MTKKTTIIVNTLYRIHTLAKPIDNNMQHPILPCNLPVLKIIFHQIAFSCFLKTSITYINEYMF